MLTAKENGEVAGYILLLFKKNSGWCRFYSLAVAKEFQSRGLGKALMLKAIAYAKAKKLKGITLEVHSKDKQVYDFYCRLGFTDKIFMPKFYEDNSDAMRMIYKFNNQKG